MESVSNIETNLKHGIYNTKRKHGGKSDIWRSFSVVCDDDGKELNFVSCDKCTKILIYNGHKSGTSGLRRHTCVGFPGQSKLNFTDDKLQILTQIRQEATEKCMKLSCQDIRPYDLMTGRGFVDLSQYLVDVAAKYGSFDVRDILPHPTTVSTLAEEQARALLASVAAEIKPVVENYGCAITTDIWTEDCHKTSFISGTINYINANYDLVSRVLFAAPFESGVSTGENIRSLLFQKLCEFGIDASLLSNRVVFVTDRGANIVAALRGYTRLNCNTHILNDTLSSAFAPGVLAETIKLSELLTNAKQLVKYFKNSGQQSNLEEPLTQSIDARWNSNYDMLDSILQQHDEISTILLKNNQYDRIAHINVDTLKTVVSFLKVFKEAANDLEANKATPTTSLPLPWSIRLIEHCQASTLEPLLSKVAEVCVSRLQELMGTCETSASPLHMMYKIATLLTPKMRLLRMIPADAKEDVLKGAKEIITKMHFDSIPTTAEGEPSAKKPKDADRFADWEDGTPFSSEPKSIDVEMAEYLSIKLTENPDPDRVLHWWKFYKEQFPILSKLARFIFSIPASCVPTERAFGVCGRILEERRTGLSPESINNILFLHRNIVK